MLATPTKFIHPIKDPICISEHFGFYLDNPRTDDEYNEILEALKREWLADDVAEFVTPNSELAEHIGRLSNEVLSVHKTEQSSLTESIKGARGAAEFYARYWVIVRYENENLLRQYEKTHAQRENLYDMKEILSFIVANEHRSKILDGYAKVLHMLLQKNLEGRPMGLLRGLSGPESIGTREIQDNLRNCSGNKALWFTTFLEAVKLHVKQIDERLKQGGKTEEQRLLYIGAELPGRDTHKNTSSSLVRLVSVIELLLTHQPDFRRFNVEDSITKQFTLKTSLLAYMEDGSINLPELGESLKQVYAQRSCIVHGNFDKVKDLEASLEVAYKHARICLLKYLEKPVLMDFLKKA